MNTRPSAPGIGTTDPDLVTLSYHDLLIAAARAVIGTEPGSYAGSEDALAKLRDAIEKAETP